MSSAFESMTYSAAYFEPDAIVRFIGGQTPLSVEVRRTLEGNVYKSVHLWKLDHKQISEAKAKKILEENWPNA